jgi:demethylmenaquinone methyltransferase/2-methoxy-6-polyprenyl-1,4-benzoquinol methylase
MKLYPDSGVELNPFMSKNYDKVMNLGSVGLYKRFINQAVADMNIAPSDNILDMGCGTGRNAMLMYQYLGEEGKITGLDISSEMEEQFLKKFKDKKHVKFINKRIDIDFDLDEKFEKVFISFVIHGFPHDVRDAVIKNAFKHLKPGGEFIILDFAEFDMDKMPFLHRKIFKAVECKYAFDYIKRDWKKILKGYGFDNFREYFYMKKYVRLLRSVKEL